VRDPEFLVRGGGKWIYDKWGESGQPIFLKLEKTGTYSRIRGSRGEEVKKYRQGLNKDWKFGG